MQLTCIYLGQFQVYLLTNPTYTFFVSEEIKPGLLLTGTSQARVEMTVFRALTGPQTFPYVLCFSYSTWQIFLVVNSMFFLVCYFCFCFLQLTYILHIYILWDSDQGNCIFVCFKVLYFKLYNLWFFQSSKSVSDLNYKNLENWGKY